MKSLRGRDGFEAYHSALFGARWNELRAELIKPARQVGRLNGFAAASVPINQNNLHDFAGCRAVTDVNQLPTPKKNQNSLYDYYLLDGASIWPVRALRVEARESVLDLCAAPGGKALIIAEALGQDGQLVVNELSDRRRARLKAVLRDYVPSEVLERIRVTGHDAARWCLYETSSYDRILCDVPCSGERHLLHDPGELDEWSQSRAKNLAVRQYAILASALQVVRPGGRIVYSTCSINPIENDQVIARLLKKRRGEVEVQHEKFALGEATELGWSIMPDRAEGYGPIYFSILQRVQLTSIIR